MMLNPMMPEEVAVKRIPMQLSNGLKELFAFREFQGIFVMRKLHFVAQVFNVVWCTLVLFNVFRDEDVGGIVVGIVVYPIVLIYMASIIRVLSELAISVLLVPSLLAKQEAGGPGRGGQSVNGADADLAAYGVSGVDDAGTVV